MTTSSATHAPHPLTAAAMLRSAEAHELAAQVLSCRNTAAAKEHAELAAAFRAKAAPGV